LEGILADTVTFHAEWTGAELDPTASRLRIEIAGLNACRAENQWSKSIDEAPHLSAGPLAFWLAANWWRLRWESEPVSGQRDTNWRMAHEVPAAGGGFLWPQLSFIADGEWLLAECSPTAVASHEMLRYIASFDLAVSASAFEVGVDNFIDLVLERVGDDPDFTPLQTLWSTVRDERRDPAAREERRVEAMLGYDPGEASPMAAAVIETVLSTQGVDAAAELAALCNAPNRDERLNNVLDATRQAPDVEGHLERDLLKAGPLSGGAAVALTYATGPQEQGQVMAAMARAAAGFSVDAPLCDGQLARLLGIVTDSISSANTQGSKRGFGLAILNGHGRDSYRFQARHPHGRRFEAARFLGDAILQPTDGWHLTTPTATARQKAQRSFASEFLAPITGLQEQLQQDFSMEAIEDAAAHFNVSSYLVGSHLRNNGIIPYGHPAVPR
jgi:hypothetical protein